MKCLMSEQATNRLNGILQQQEDKTLKVRVFVAFADESDTRYGLGLDVQNDKDELVVTKSGIEVLMEKKEKFLNGVEIDYKPDEDKWVITKHLQQEF